MCWFQSEVPTPNGPLALNSQKLQPLGFCTRTFLVATFKFGLMRANSSQSTSHGYVLEKFSSSLRIQMPAFYQTPPPPARLCCHLRSKCPDCQGCCSLSLAFLASFQWLWVIFYDWFVIHIRLFIPSFIHRLFESSRLSPAGGGDMGLWVGEREVMCSLV